MGLNTRTENCPNCKAKMESLFVIGMGNALDSEWFFECPKCRSLFKSIHASSHISRNVLFFFLSFFLGLVFIVSSIIFFIHLKTDGFVPNPPIVFSSLVGIGCILGIVVALKNYKKHAYGKLNEIDNKEYEEKVKVAGQLGVLSTHNKERTLREIIKQLLIVLLALVFLNYKHLLGL